ncbi:hypothetical protein PaecuDRAFT_0009 [Paenibacillus curdlanolyticus YK9]|uniref:Uncharacterized protein n=1 Tax=Paenibacillus curdlanolyticus YK9 TaxID=717606 RepID=E0I4G7_9BACL|nr:hypothetical protein [Paenibacillus curdlanolyticus]EFM12498.1 hypothetical protein PaecuDRAFT_0009 [Paenibacillus curdlanolyticus YK9]
MKSINFTHVISSTILGVALIIGCLIFAGNDKSASGSGPQEIAAVSLTKPLLTIPETAAYLHIPESKVRTIIQWEVTMSNTTGTSVGMALPVIEIDGDMYVITKGLEEWLQDAVHNRKEYF